MFRFLWLTGFFILTTASAEAQGNLSEFFSIVRTDGRNLSANSRSRGFEILRPYIAREKSLDGEWQTLNDAISDSDPFVRDQACAALASIVLLHPAQPISLPDTTRDLVIQRFGEAGANLRENAIRIVSLMEGGVPPAVTPQLLNMARTDPADNVRSVAISALASIPKPSPEITEFWMQSLNAVSKRDLRGDVLNAFRFNPPSDPRIISLVIDALRDTDYYVRQEAIAAVIKIGKPAAAALPLLTVIRDAPANDERGMTMRSNAEVAIRILSTPPASR